LCLQVSNVFALPIEGKLIGGKSVMLWNATGENDTFIVVDTLNIDRPTDSPRNSKIDRTFTLPFQGELMGGESALFRSAPTGSKTLIVVDDLSLDSVSVTIDQPAETPGNCNTTLTLNASKSRSSFMCEGHASPITIANKGSGGSLVEYKARAIL
jgi:hypothetical protein